MGLKGSEDMRSIATLVFSPQFVRGAPLEYRATAREVSDAFADLPDEGFSPATRQTILQKLQQLSDVGDRVC